MTGVQQVGGDHYNNAAGVAHWDVCEKHDIDYLAATATKYVCRFDRKEKPVEDLKKGRSYLEKMLESDRGPRRTVPQDELEAFYAAQSLSPVQRRVCNLVLGSTLVDDVRAAVHHVNQMLYHLEPVDV